LLNRIQPGSIVEPIQSGGQLVTIPNVRLPHGWNRSEVTILFVAPPGYPAAQPDCFWVEPGGVRLTNGATPQGTNDSNPIPGVGQRGTWFSWHLKGWDPNHDSLVSYLKVILRRFQSLQ
jgi:hypothetical protein